MKFWLILGIKGKSMLQIILVVGVGIVLGTIGVSYLKGFQKGLRDNENKQNSYLEPKKFSQFVREAA